MLLSCGGGWVGSALFAYRDDDGDWVTEVYEEYEFDIYDFSSIEKVLMQRILIVRNDITIPSFVLINAVEDYWKNIISTGKEEYGDGFSLGYTFPIDDDTYAYCINDDKIDLHKIANSYEHLMTFKDKATLLKLEEQLDFDFIVHDEVKIGLWFKPLDDSLIERLLK